MRSQEKPVITLRFTPDQLKKGFAIKIKPGKRGESSGMVISPNETITPKCSSRVLELADLKETIVLTAAKVKASRK